MTAADYPPLARLNALEARADECDAERARLKELIVLTAQFAYVLNDGQRLGERELSEFKRAVEAVVKGSE